jgi:hypothetical protein
MQLNIKLKPKDLKEFNSWVGSIYVSAMESGHYSIGYWCEVLRHRYKNDKDFKGVIEMDAEYEDDKDKRISKRRQYTIDRNVIIRGIKRIASGKIKVNQEAVSDCVTFLATGEGDFDGERADVIVQAGLFNEVIFG